MIGLHHARYYFPQQNTLALHLRFKFRDHSNVTLCLNTTRKCRRIATFICDVYPKRRTVLANAVLQAFGAQNLQMARYTSESLSTKTIRVRHKSRSTTTNYEWKTSTSRSEGYKLHGCPLLTTDEVRKLPQDRVLVFEQGIVPLFLQRPNYLTAAECQSLAAPYPVFQRATPRQRKAL